MGFFTNPLFLMVWLLIVVGQFAIVEVGSHALKVHVDGLTNFQWAIRIGTSFVSLIWNFVLKAFVPDHICPVLGDESEEDIKAADADYKALRKMRDLSNSQ